MPPTIKPFDRRFFTRRLRRLSVVTAVLAVLIPIRFKFDYNLADGVFLVFVLGSYDLTYRRERRRAVQADQSTYLKWRLAGSLGFLLLASIPPIIAAILGFPPGSFFPYYTVAAAGFWTGIIAGEWHWRWKNLEKLSGEERSRYWRRYNDALFYTIPF
jgi:hypothetical protein